MKRGKSRLAVVLGVVAFAAIVSLGAGAAGAKGPKPPPAGKPACSLGKGGKIQHVIYLQFDNVHFFRDNPNVPSDLEQMPNLLDFLKQNGTLLTNDHTVLISHTGGGILASLTGLYPNRQGQAVSNSYGYFRPDGSVGFSSSFKYWTDQTDAGNPATVPPTPAGDTNFNMVNNDTRHSAARARRATRRRRGCRSRAPAATSATSAPPTPSSRTTTRSSSEAVPRRSRRARPWGRRTSRSPASPASPPARRSRSTPGRTSRTRSIATVGTAGATGTGITLTAPLTKAHSTPPAGATGVTVYGPTATDPTGDMTKVFAAGSTEWNEGKASQLANPGTPRGTSRRPTSSA